MVNGDFLSNACEDMHDCVDILKSSATAVKNESLHVVCCVYQNQNYILLNTTTWYTILTSGILTY